MVKEFRCRDCGETDEVEFYKHYKSICKTCRSKQVVKNSYGQEKERRKELVKSKKYACEPCGFFTYSKQLLDTHFHSTKHGMNEKVIPDTEIKRLEEQLKRLRSRVSIRLV